MTKRGTKTSVIDLFSGPGGLSEGFARYNSGRNFGPFVSVEMDPIACNTLRFRKLFHLLNGNNKKLKEQYYDYVKSGKNLKWSDIKEDFGKYADRVDRSVWEHELGSKSPAGTCQEIEERLLNLGHKETDKLVLIGGPPCQAYSLIGRSSRKQMTERGDYAPEGDDRHFLYEWYLKILPRFKPDVFIMENVPGILSSRINGEGIFERILIDLKKPGYKLFPLTRPVQEDMFQEHGDYKIKSHLYGVPQARERVIILGIRDDLLPNQISPLEEKPESHSEHVLDDMPVLRSGLSKIDRVKTEDDVKNWKKELKKGWSCLNGAPREVKEKLREVRDQIQELDYKYERGGRFVPCKRYGQSNSLPSELQDWYIDKNLGGYLNHEARSHMDSDLRRYLFNSVFTKVKKRPPLLGDYPEALLPDHKNRHSGNHKDRFRTVVPNLPSKTITSHISKDGHAYIHYDPLQCRSLTVREAARLQSFPDNYFFCGNRTQQYHQVGNAVPPYLAKQIAEVVAGILEKT